MDLEAMFAPVDYSALVKGKHVLLVHCDSELEEVISDLLRQHQAQVSCVQSIAQLQEIEPADVVICGTTQQPKKLFHEMDPMATVVSASRDMEIIAAAVRHSIGHMMQNCCGNVILLLSEFGAYNAPGRSCESAASGAAEAFCNALAMDYCKYNIRCNSIRMAFHTGKAGAQRLHELQLDAQEAKDLQLIRRCADAQDVANAVLFLASNMSAFISGETIPLTGGGFAIGHNQVWRTWLQRIRTEDTLTD